MARTDLLPQYSGWQALDATCQETSKGKISEKGLSKSRGEVKQRANKAVQYSSFAIFQWKDAKGQELTLLTTHIFGLCSSCSSKSSITAP